MLETLHKPPPKRAPIWCAIVEWLSDLGRQLVVVAHVCTGRKGISPKMKQIKELYKNSVKISWRKSKKMCLC